MDVHSTVGSLLAIAIVAVLAPVTVALLPGPRIPQVVLLLTGGMLIGPQALHLASPQGVQILADVGLGFLFLLAGYEVDQRLLVQDVGRHAALSWVGTMVLALGVVGLLQAAGLVRAFVPVAIALTTTALGTLLPILREHDLLRGRLGGHLLAAGAFGELLPIIAVALFLGATDRLVALVSLAAVVVVAYLLTLLSRSFRITRLRTIIEEGEHATTQISVRGAVLLLVVLLAVTERSTWTPFWAHSSQAWCCAAGRASACQSWRRSSMPSGMASSSRSSSSTRG
jgi:Kef-type K+ transport system membrane component KefB